MSVVAWSKRVGDVWTSRSTGARVTIRGHHVHAGLVLVAMEDGPEGWLRCDEFEAGYEPGRCGECGSPERAEP